jgi:small subunit ribosomal protein S8
MFTDPIADMLTRIRNALMAHKGEVKVPFSKIKFSIAQILADEKYIDKVEIEKNAHTEIKIKLKYDDGKPGIQLIERVSTPGRRVYEKNQDLPQVLSGQGILIISTPQGLMTSKDAKKKHLGGEIICKVY